MNVSFANPTSPAKSCPEPSKVEEQLQAFQDQMKVLTEKMEQSNDQRVNFQTEIKSLREEKQPDYRAADEPVTPGRIVIPPPKHQSML